MCYNSLLLHVLQGPNFASPQSYFLQSPIAEKFRDLSINWSSSTRSNQISCRPPSFLSPSVLQFDSHNRGDSCRFSQPTSKDRATACSVEKKRGINDLMGKFMSEYSKNHTVDGLHNNQKAGSYSYIRRLSYYFYCNLIPVFRLRGF